VTCPSVVETHKLYDHHWWSVVLKDGPNFFSFTLKYFFLYQNIIQSTPPIMSPGKTANISFDSNFANIINGEARTKSDNYHQGVNPATGEKLWDVPIANQSDVDEAVASAQKAFESWSVKPIEERKELLRNFRDLWSGYQEEFTTLLCKETGKPRQFAAFEVGAVGAWFDHHVSLSIPEERLEDDEKVMTTRYMPLGVVGAICPWNVCILSSVFVRLEALLTMSW
jgi:acyl-CoA reductase-like NAD-dependent aldehyde dehydrogenase